MGVEWMCTIMIVDASKSIDKVVWLYDHVEWNWTSEFATSFVLKTYRLVIIE